MKTKTIKKLVLGASCAALLSALAAQSALAQTAPAAAPMPAPRLTAAEPQQTPRPPYATQPAAMPQPAVKAAVDAPLGAAPVHKPVMQPADVNKQILLRDAVAVGVSTNPEYRVVANNRRATDEELRQAKALYRPSIDMRADTGYEHNNDPFTRAGAGSEVENMWRYDTGLTLTQLLFDGFETKYENLRQKARVLSASHRVREASELIGLSVIESYLDVLRQRELLRIARENVAEHISIQQQISDSASAGRSTQADMEQAKARLAAARSQESSVRNALRVAEAAYIRDVGDPPQNLVMPLVPVDRLEANIDEEVKLSLYQSPTLAIFNADIEVAHAEFEGSKSTFYPQLDLQLNGHDGYNLNGVSGRDKSASALVVMNWNLYRGGGDTARVREQINREAQAKESRAKSARNVENDVRQTWAQMVSAGERAHEFAAQTAANVEVVKAYKDQFDLNRRTLLDVLDSQNVLFVSRATTVNSEFTEMFAVYRLLALKGELLQTLEVPYPRESDPAKM